MSIEVNWSNRLFCHWHPFSYPQWHGCLPSRAPGCWASQTHPPSASSGSVWCSVCTDSNCSDPWPAPNAGPYSEWRQWRQITNYFQHSKTQLKTYKSLMSCNLYSYIVYTWYYTVQPFSYYHYNTTFYTSITLHEDILEIWLVSAFLRHRFGQFPDWSL